MSAAYYKTKESVKEYIRLAMDVNGGELINRLRKFLPSDASLLEIGSGPGTDWKLLNKHYQLVGSDNSKEFLAHLNSENPGGRFMELDAITLKTDEKFDGIYSNKVMHHLKNEELLSSIERQFALLNKGGIICHSFWAGEGSEYFKGLFVNYHTKSALEDFFVTYFEILVIAPYKEFEDEDSLLLIGRKK